MQPLSTCLLLGALSCTGVSALGQTIVLTDSSPYTQNFDELSLAPGSTTNNLTLPGWHMTEAGGGARDNELYAVDTGSSNTGDTYSYGAAGTSDRALGSLQSGTLIPCFGAAFANSTGFTITGLEIAYTGEQWRLGTADRTDRLNFQYSLDASSLTTGTWTDVAALTFTTPDTTTVGAKNGNAPTNRTSLASTIGGLTVADGATVWVRWGDGNASGADDGLAVDDLTVKPVFAIPEPTTCALVCGVLALGLAVVGRRARNR
jgi:hypothetical protein